MRCQRWSAGRRSTRAVGLAVAVRAPAPSKNRADESRLARSKRARGVDLNPLSRLASSGNRLYKPGITHADVRLRPRQWAASPSGGLVFPNENKRSQPSAADQPEKIYGTS